MTTTSDTLSLLGIPFETNAPLGPLTWYGVGGCADFLARPESADQLAQLVAYTHGKNLPLRILGKGANLLVVEGPIGGVVVLLDAPAFTQTTIDADTGVVTAAAGASLEQLITATVREGLAGLETLAGIPATIGGALRMNAGGAFGEIGTMVESVERINLAGEIETLHRAGLQFAYRQSNLSDCYITAATFALTPTDDQPMLRARLKEVMAYKKNSQPMAADSAGCAFKNPKSQSDKGAGQIIDEAGLKGAQIGGAEVSAIHANFIVLHSGGAAADVLALMNHVQQQVREKSGISLTPEVVVWDDRT